MPKILARIHAHGGEVKRAGWRLKIVKRGDLDGNAMRWISENRADLMREIWSLYDDWEERAAIREFDGGQSREDANNAALREVLARC